MHLLRPILAATAAVLIAPQVASAATVDPLGACYRSLDTVTRESVPVVGRDFTPGQKVSVAIDGQVVQSGVDVDKDGNVIGSVSAPYQAKGQRAFTLTLTQEGQAENTASAMSRVTALGLRLKPQRSAPSRRVRFIGRGFTDGTAVYAHYVRAGKHRRTVSLGAPQGPCGRIDVKRRQIPIKRPAVGRWTLQVDNQPTYSAEPVSVFVRIGITVRRVPRQQTP